LPFLHYPKSHFNLKTEVAHALKQVNVDADQLLYLHDELDELNQMYQLNRLKIVLVDHNNVVPMLQPFADSIVRIIDHHKLVEPSLIPASCNRTIKLVGSCSSLVSAAIDELKVELPDQLKSLLASAILKFFSW